MPLSAIVNAIGAGLSYSQAQKNMEMQKDFAKHGVRWKVEDAKAAGIHPIYALGAQTHSFAPVSIGDTTSALSNMGQDISRAVHATRTPDEKATAYQQALQALQLERGKLENTLLASQIRKINQPATPPGLPAGSDVPPALQQFGQTIQRDPYGFAQAQKVQDEYGDVVEGAHGIMSYLDSVWNSMGVETDQARNRRMVREFQRYRRLGGRLPAADWIRNQGLDRPTARGSW